MPWIDTRHTSFEQQQDPSKAHGLLPDRLLLCRDELADMTHEEGEIITTISVGLASNILSAAWEAHQVHAAAASSDHMTVAPRWLDGALDSAISSPQHISSGGAADGLCHHRAACWKVSHLCRPAAAVLRHLSICNRS